MCHFLLSLNIMLLTAGESVSSLVLADLVCSLLNFCIGACDVLARNKTKDFSTENEHVPTIVLFIQCTEVWFEGGTCAENEKLFINQTKD